MTTPKVQPHATAAIAHDVAPNQISQDREKTGLFRWLAKINPVSTHATGGRVTQQISDIRRSNLHNSLFIPEANNQSEPANFNRPDDLSGINLHFNEIAITDVTSSVAYNQIDDQLESIYTQQNIDDFINGDDISSLLNGLHHNQNNDYLSEDLDKINILYSNLLINDAAASGLSPDFVQSLKLSILYIDLKSKGNEAGVQAILKHVAETKDQNLFILETISSSEIRSDNAHATGRVITRHPKKAAGHSLISINVNKGYLGDPDRGQYSFCFLSDQPTMRELQYPKHDAYSNASRLYGKSQVVGNCGIIAFKEALQLAKAFENTAFKKAFFVRARAWNPFAGIGSKRLKAQFKSLYGFGKSGQTRIQDQLGTLLLNKLKAKAAIDATGQTQIDVERVKSLINARQIQKLNRAAIKEGDIPKNREPLAVIPETVFFQNDAKDAVPHLMDVKTLIKTKQSIISYLGLHRSQNEHKNPAAVIAALAKLWNSEVGTQDEKANLTKNLIEKLISSEHNHHTKIEFVERLVELADFKITNSSVAKKATDAVMMTAVDELNRYISSKKSIQGLLTDDRTMKILNHFVTHNHLKSVEIILSSLIFHTVPEKESYLIFIHRLFTQDPKNANDQNTKEFIHQLTNNDALLTALKEGLSQGNQTLNLSRWYSLIQCVIRAKLENMNSDTTEPLANKKAIDNLKKDWGKALLKASEHQLNADKMTTVKDAIRATSYSFNNLGMDESHIQNVGVLKSAVARLLNDESGSFINAMNVTRYSKAAQEVLRSADASMITKKVLSEYRSDSSVKKDNIAAILRYLNPIALRGVLSEIIRQPEDFESATIYQKRDIIEAVNTLCDDVSDDSQQVVARFIDSFSETFSKDLSSELETVLDDGADFYITLYTQTLITLVEWSQKSSTPIRYDQLLKEEQIASFQSALLSQPVITPQTFLHGTQLLTDYAAALPNSHKKDKVFSDIIALSQQLLASGNKEAISHSIFRLAYLASPPHNLNLNTFIHLTDFNEVISKITKEQTDPASSSRLKSNSTIVLNSLQKDQTYLLI